MRAPAAVLLVLALAGCQGPGDVIRAVTSPFRPDAAPAWYQDPPRREGWVFATGSAPRGQDDAAMAQAQRELASQIRLTIQVDDRRVDRGTVRESTGSGRVERYQSEARTAGRAKAEAADLPGVAVEREETVGERCYVLIGLDRTLWAADLRQRIAGLDQSIAAEIAARAADQGPGAAARLLHRLAPLFAERDDLVESLQAAAPGQAAPKEPVDRAGLLARLEARLAAVTVELPAGADCADLLPLLTDALAGVGVRAAATGEAPTLRLRLGLRTQVLVIDGQHRVDAQATGWVESAANGRRLGGIQLAERASAPLEATARDRLAQKLARRLADELDRRLMDMLQGM